MPDRCPLCHGAARQLPPSPDDPLRTAGWQYLSPAVSGGVCPTCLHAAVRCADHYAECGEGRAAEGAARG
jgi:hypothetical protein